MCSRPTFFHICKVFHNTNSRYSKTTPASKSWLQSKQVHFLDWPVCSPDLKPIEDLWGMLARRVYGNSTQYANVQALKDAMAREWNAIPRSTIKKLVASMLNQIFDVISRQGQTTKH
ncbi:unnamed protein product, partial [Mesorhabditis belari]|uniref:Tc1-like transposase DDE domain-containing protein n=1 Tax=Mesorhabditis belari TaxID=2138241 RepID=A0AAF3F6C6_9BILA